MEIDKTQLTDDVAAAVWASRDPLGMEAPFSDQDPMVKFFMKAEVLPVINHTLEAAEKTFKEKIRSIIARGHSLGLDADGILLDLDMELA